MTSLYRRITAKSVDEVVCGALACALLAACTVLFVLMLPSLARPVVALVAVGLTVGWEVLASQAWTIGRRLVRRG
jgi:MFS superfamily sulfate permease-like transporter